MAIKFEKIRPGDELWDVHPHKMGNTTMTELGAWPVKIVSVDRAKRAAVVIWNTFNRPETWFANRLQKLYRNLPPSYLRQEERRRAR